jgi:hypothetical protein
MTIASSPLSNSIKELRAVLIWEMVAMFQKYIKWNLTGKKILALYMKFTVGKNLLIS